MSKLLIECDDGQHMCTFHSLDGMYSVCTIDGKDDALFHLSVSTPLRKVGDHYEIDGKEGE